MTQLLTEPASDLATPGLLAEPDSALRLTWIIAVLLAKHGFISTFDMLNGISDDRLPAFSMTRDGREFLLTVEEL